ncbi:hypothetical protein HKBW3S25_01880, partial [Candidatus Hakubella thermalkaliphila]
MESLKLVFLDEFSAKVLHNFSAANYTDENV